VAQSDRRRGVDRSAAPGYKISTLGGDRPKFTPCLWFDGKAEEAARFYTAIFNNSKITGITHYSAASAEAANQPQGAVMTVAFELAGQPFLALNGGPQFSFTPAISFIVNCEDQKEVDSMWQALSKGGEESQCGWLQDKFGVSWQIVPAVLGELMQSEDPQKAERVIKALLQMQKIDIDALVRASA